MNTITIFGRLTKDAEQKQTSNGRAFLSLSLADNVNKDSVIFWNVPIFEQEPYKNMIPYFKKGSSLVITGSVRQIKPFTTQNGDLIVSAYVNPYKIDFGPSRKDSQQPGDNDQNQQHNNNNYNNSPQQQQQQQQKHPQEQSFNQHQDELPF